MANLRIIQPSFAAGELTPALHARVDLAKYSVGAKQLRNFFVHAHGGVSNRQGTDYVATALGPTVLIPFQYNVEQSYVLEFSDYTMRVLKDGGLVSHTTDTVFDWATSTSYAVNEYAKNDDVVYRCIADHTSGASTEPGTGSSWATAWVADAVLRIVTPYPEEALDGLKTVQSADVVYLTHPDYPPHMLTRSSHTGWAFAEMTFSPRTPSPATPTGAYNGTGSYDVEYQISAVSRLTGEESLPSGPVTVSADTAGSWEAGKYVTLAWGDSFFYTAGATAGHWGSVLHGSAFTVIFYGEFYYTSATGGDPGINKPNDVYHEGALLTEGTYGDLEVGEWAWGGNSALGYNTVFIRAYKFSKVRPDAFSPEAVVFQYEDLSDTVNPDYYFKIYKNTRGYFGFIGTSDSTNFRDDNISPDAGHGPQTSEDPFDGEGNYPGTAGIYQQRMIWGRSDKEPQTVWTSQTGLLTNMGTSRPLQDSDAITVALASTQINEIRWFVPFSELLVFTSGGEWILDHGSNSDALTPTSVQFKPQGYRGCADVRPIVIGDTVLFVQRGGKVVRDLQYRLESDKYAGNNLSVLSEHLFRNKTIVAWAYQQTPNSIVWVVLDDGSFCSFTYLPEHEVWAWCPQETDGVVEEAAAIPGDDEDEVYFVVKRNVGGVDVRYIEKLHTRNFTSIEDAYFVDCGLSYDDDPATVFSGLDHLIGETVSILADGNVMPQQVVAADGTITLAHEASVVHVGLPYTSTLETLNVDLSAPGDTLQGKKKVINQVTLRLEDTREIWVGPDVDHLVQVPFRTDEGYEEATRLFTGDKRQTIRSSWGTNGRIVIRQSDPLPITVLAIIPEVSPGG